MASDIMDWDDAYRQEAGLDGPPPWNIGEPQPELVALLSTAQGDVLDVGCSHAELALAVAERGHTVVGIDLAPTAVAAASAAAAERGLDNATFVCDDITSFTGYDGRFGTIFDSTLFHSLPVEGREGYRHRSTRAAAPGAPTTCWCSPQAPSRLTWRQKPHVSEPELREAVGRHFTIDEVRPAWIHVNTPDGMPVAPGAPATTRAG